LTAIIIQELFSQADLLDAEPQSSSLIRGERIFTGGVNIGVLD
jgi:hypothetical protein